jgi:hypothetical protein
VYIACFINVDENYAGSVIYEVRETRRWCGFQEDISDKFIADDTDGSTQGLCTTQIIIIIIIIIII